MIIKSRFVLPIDSPPIKRGAVAFENGRITAVGPSRELVSNTVVDFGDAVTLPGFVNAHTHLELTDLAGLVPPSDSFVDWLERLMANIMADSRTETEIDGAVVAGIEQSLASGVTTVGDITSHPEQTRRRLATSNLRSVSFGEVIAIGRLRTRLQERLAEAACDTHASARLHIGVSPHSPYTLEPTGMRACARRAGENKLPLCIHLAETREEEQFTRSLEGPLVDYLQAMNVWDHDIPCPGMSPLQLAHSAGLLGPQSIVAHANYLADADMTCLAGSGASVAYCPRTHAAFGHEAHRFQEMIAAGVNVCLGTDSLASNPSLSLLDEVRFSRERSPDIDPHEWLKMATLNGAWALGYGEVVGSIAVGKAADLVVVPLPAGAKDWTSLLQSNETPSAVYVDGVPIQRGLQR